MFARLSVAVGAICALSGGVDSAVAATLVDRALHDGKAPSRLTCIFVNNGVLRKNEFEKVQQNLPAPAEIEVCAGAVLPGCSCTKPQALGAVPQPTHETRSGSYCLKD
jgi:hypothetical protein